MEFIFKMVLPKLRGNFFEPSYVFMKDIPIHCIYRNLCVPDEEHASWRTSADEPTIRRMDSGTAVKERARVITHFSPLANNRIDIAGTRDEIDLLISTDVLSEGQNLQDCGTLIH